MASSSPLPSTPSLDHHSPGRRKRRRAPPIFISTSHADVEPADVRDLLLASGLSCRPCHHSSTPEPVDLRKLRLALSHSSIVVSAFCSSRHMTGEEELPVLEGLFARAVPVPVAERRLVGFGRAVSDGGLTASIHDVAVTPTLQRLGIGRKVVQRLLRFLTSKEIYDISALCAEDARSFFEACGFGDDCLGSTTMMYTRSTSPDPEFRPTHSAARRLLLVPPPLVPIALPCKRISVRYVS